MLALQRRFDEPLHCAKELMDSGAICRIFESLSTLEDSNTAPNGDNSGGILPDLSVHNVDEILWLTGRMPSKALAVGSRVYSHALTTSLEDFDDLCFAFGSEKIYWAKYRSAATKFPAIVWRASFSEKKDKFTWATSINS